MPLRSDTTRSTLLGLLAAVIAAAGAWMFVRGLLGLGAARGDCERVVLLLVLGTAGAVCSRFPIKVGVGAVTVMIDSIPLLLGALLLPATDAVLVAVAVTVVAMIGQPSLPGKIGWFWRVQTPLATGAAMAATVWLTRPLLDGDGGSHLVVASTALVVALLLEAMFQALVVIELEAETRGQGMLVLEARTTMLANVALPTVSAAILTPYLDRSVWVFAAVLPVLVVSMYGALWIANSQQLEKRRGDRLKDTFSRYVPEGIVDDNLETMQRVELGGEQRDISVLFCDIRGFTTWAEDKGAAEVIAELNVLLGELSASVMDTGGTLDKFTGDGLMAFWGAPVPNEHHAEFACRAALDMLERLEAVNQRRKEEGQAPFAMGVAVHSGPAVVGNVGHERRLDYTAIGDTVNTAARLEASTKELGAVLVVSRATVDRLHGDLYERAMRIGDVTLKGKARSVEAWALPPLPHDVEEIDGDPQGGIAA